MSRGVCATASGTCGLSIFYGFNHQTGPLNRSVSGTGFCVAGFVNTPECYSAYKELKKKYTIVYQSPVRKNNYSGNNFFFIVFDTRKPS